MTDASCDTYKPENDKCMPNKDSGTKEHAEFDVTWKASDDHGLSDVTVIMKDEDGDVVASDNPSVSGTVATGTTTLETTGDDVFGETYTIVVRATDTSSQSATAEGDYVADG